MSAEIADLIDRSTGAPGALIDLIRDRGGAVIPAAENNQPEPRLQIASLHYAGFTGIGPGLIGAARDWRRQATRTLAPGG